MKRFADSLVRQNGIKPPPGYKTSVSICSAFLKQHAPKKADAGIPGMAEPKPVSSAQLFYATKIPLGKAVVIPDEARTNSATMAAWIDSTKAKKRGKSGRKTSLRSAGAIAAQSTAPTKRSRKRKADAVAVASTSARPNPIAGTPLRIPYGNKDLALKLGARYRSGGWYAPPGVETGPFEERGWL
jgi:DNA topoisomerase-3